MGISLTNRREALAFALAMGVQTLALFWLNPLFEPVYQAADIFLPLLGINPATWGVVCLFDGLGFGLFLLLRAVLGAVPLWGAAGAGPHALDVSDSEIGAFLIGWAVQLLVLLPYDGWKYDFYEDVFIYREVNGWLPDAIDAFHILRAIGLAYSFLSLAAFFCAFVGLRRRFSAEEIADLGRAS